MTAADLLTAIRSATAVHDRFTTPRLDAVPVTPSDSADLADAAVALIIGTAGSLKITTLEGVDRTYPGVPAGVFPVACRRVWATPGGTAATNIVALI